jgi:hypothetical protein
MTPKPVSDQHALTGSQAGLRLIALLTITNSGKIDRLRAYLRDNFHAAALEERSAPDRVAQIKLILREAGRLRVRQVVATEKHRAVVILGSERGSHYLADMACEEDYPHRVLAFDLVLLPDMQAGDGESAL